MTPARVTARIHGVAQLPRVSVMTTGSSPLARASGGRRAARRRAPRAVPATSRPTSFRSAWNSAGIAASATLSRSASIRFECVARLERERGVVRRNGARLRSLRASWISPISTCLRGVGRVELRPPSAPAAARRRDSPGAQRPSPARGTGTGCPATPRSRARTRARSSSRPASAAFRAAATSSC